MSASKTNTTIPEVTSETNTTQPVVSLQKDPKKEAFKNQLMKAMAESKVAPEPIIVPTPEVPVATINPTTPSTTIMPSGIDPNNLISPIKFAEALGKPPQYIYQLLRTNKVPANVYIMIKSGDKEMPRFLKSEAIAWWNARPTRGQSVSTSIITNPDQIIQRMVDMFQQVAKDNPQNANIQSLSAGLQKLIEDTNTEAATAATN